MKHVLVTGSSGLIGSEAVAFFDAARLGRCTASTTTCGATSSAPTATRRWNLERLRRDHHALHAPRRSTSATATRCSTLLARAPARPHRPLRRAAVARPRRDRPFDDFDVNAVGTLNLLEAARRTLPESPFVFICTNKVYGDAPNELPLVELETRWDYADPADCARHRRDDAHRRDACTPSSAPRRSPPT